MTCWTKNDLDATEISLLIQDNSDPSNSEELFNIIKDLLDKEIITYNSNKADEHYKVWK